MNSVERNPTGMHTGRPPLLEGARVISGLNIRLSVETDMEYWKLWINDPEVLPWFPVSSSEEIDVAARHVFSFVPRNAVLTAELEGRPCGIAGLDLPGYSKIRHQAMFSIIVDKSCRNLGIGSALLQALLAAAKAWHGVSLVLLEVFEGNPARSLYQRMGFVDFGFQPFYSKMEDQFLGRHLMCKAL
jgi:putative acetyltransferase